MVTNSATTRIVANIFIAAIIAHDNANNNRATRITSFMVLLMWCLKWYAYRNSNPDCKGRNLESYPIGR